MTPDCFHWQAERALDRSTKFLGRRLDRLISSCDNLTLIADTRSNPRPPGNPTHGVAGKRFTPRNTPATDGTETSRSNLLEETSCEAWQEVRAAPNLALTPSRTHSGGVDADEEGDWEEDQIEATMDVYHIGQNPPRRETLANRQSLHTPSYLSKSQQLAEQMFGVRTKYTLRHGGQAPARFTTSHNRQGSEQHIRCGDTSSSESSSSIVSEHRPLTEASVQEKTAAGTSVPAIPKLCLDSVPFASEPSDTSKPNQQTMRDALNVQTARFVSARSSSSRPNSARLTMLARHPASAMIVPPRVYLPAAKPLDSPTLRLDFRMLEQSMMKISGQPPRLRVQSARTRSGCQSMSRGHADLPLKTDRALWAAGKVQFMLGNKDKLTENVERQKKDSWTCTKNADGVPSTKTTAQQPTSAVRKENEMIGRENSASSSDQEYDWVLEAKDKEADAAQHEKLTEVMFENPYFQIDFTEEVSQRKLRPSHTKEQAPPLIRVNSEPNVCVCASTNACVV